ncbi:hypothetical protein HDE_11125 [Halotydeus destructor]|nr:hypothetical protein HDE_11125 [Halotydeus destructor]
MQFLVVLVAILSPLTTGVPIDHDSTLKQAEHGGESNFTGPVNQAQPKCQSEVDVVFIFNGMMSSSDIDRSLVFSKYLSDTFGLNSSRVGFIHYTSQTYQSFSLDKVVAATTLKHIVDIERTASSSSQAIEIFNEAEAQHGAGSGKCFQVEGRSDTDVGRAAHRSVVNSMAAYIVHVMLLEVNDSELMTLSLGEIYNTSLTSVERLIGYKCEPYGQNIDDSGATGEDLASSLRSIDVSNTNHVLLVR